MVSYIGIGYYQGFKISMVDEEMMEGFGALRGQVSSTSYESGLLLDFRDRLQGSILQDSNFHVWVKNYFQQIRLLNPHHLAGGNNPAVLWEIVISFIQGTLEVEINSDQIRNSRYHPLRLDWVQSLDHTRVAYAFVRDILYSHEVDKMELWRDKQGHRGLIVSPIHLPRISPVIKIDAEEYTIIGYTAAAGILYLSDIPPAE